MSEDEVARLRDAAIEAASVLDSVAAEHRRRLRLGDLIGAKWIELAADGLRAALSGVPEGAASEPLRPGERRFRDLLARERHDVGMLARHVAEMYDEVSGGRVSIPSTMPFEVIRLVNERLDERYNDGHADGIEAAALRSVPSPEPLDVRRLEADLTRGLIGHATVSSFEPHCDGGCAASVAVHAGWLRWDGNGGLAAPQPVPEDET